MSTVGEIKTANKSKKANIKIDMKGNLYLKNPENKTITLSNVIVDCSGFNLYPRCREHSPIPAIHTCVRESRANQRFPRVSLPPLYYKACRRRRHITTRAGASSTCDGQRDSSYIVRPEARRTPSIKTTFFSILKTPLLFVTLQPAIQLL